MRKKKKKSSYGTLYSNHKRRKRRNRRIAVMVSFFLVIILAIFLFFQARNYHRETVARKQALQQFEQGNYEKAQESLENGLQYKSIFGRSFMQDMRYYLAESLFRQEKYGEALNVYQEIGRKEKTNGIVECYIGACYAKLGKVEEAKEQFEKGIQLGNEEGYHYLSKMYYDREEYEKAVEYEKEFMEKREPDGTSYMVLAKGYTGNQQYKEALEAIEKGVALDDHEKQALLFQEVVIYEKQLDFESAYKKCLDYVRAYPEDESAKKELEFLETR